MPKKPIPVIAAWSFSRWNVYKDCAFQAQCAFIDKLPQKKGPAMIRGQGVHDDADKYVKGTGKLTKELELFEDEFRELRQLYKEGHVDAEQMLCFDKDWNLLEDKFDPRVWLRVKTDSTLLLDDGLIKVRDYKTGQLKEEGYIEQLELYGLGCLLAYEGVERVIVELWFLDHGEIRPEPPMEFTAADLPRLKRLWLSRTKKMLADRRFDPRPGAHCRWCNFSQAKGGPCRY